MTIIFRSKTLDYTHTGKSRKNIPIRGLFWNGLRNYENDDIRDIAWSRSSGESIYVKSRQTQGAISIIGAFISGNDDDFFISNPFESKDSYIKISQKKIVQSAKENNYSITTYAGVNLEKIISNLLGLNIKDSLILIFSSFTGSSELSQSILRLGTLNDIVYIDIFHPFEKNPNNSIMIEGGILSSASRRDYTQGLSIYSKNIKQYLNKRDISYIQINTSENLENRLNYFFKERYHG